MKLDPVFWHLLASIATVGAALGGAGLWFMRQIIRAELSVLREHHIQPLETDVARLLDVAKLEPTRRPEIERRVRPRWAR